MSEFLPVNFRIAIKCKGCFLQEGGRCYNEKREGFDRFNYSDRVGSYSNLLADGDCTGQPLTKDTACQIINSCLNNININIT